LKNPLLDLFVQGIGAADVQTGEIVFLCHGRD